jgi:hypothetical protein
MPCAAGTHWIFPLSKSSGRGGGRTGRGVQKEDRRNLNNRDDGGGSNPFVDFGVGSAPKGESGKHPGDQQSIGQRQNQRRFG